MPKRLSTPKIGNKPTDLNQRAFQLVRESENRQSEIQPIVHQTVSRAISRIMAKMGSKGGKIGGKRRLVTMTPEQRSQVASNAAKARWLKPRKTNFEMPTTELDKTFVSTERLK